jgi:hypothetical protein
MSDKLLKEPLKYKKKNKSQVLFRTSSFAKIAFSNDVDIQLIL